jgi:hypothetical protein
MNIAKKDSLLQVNANNEQRNNTISPSRRKNDFQKQERREIAEKMLI